MDILSLLLGSDPGILGKLGLGGGQTPPIGIPPGGQPNIQGPPGGVPSMPGNAIPYGQQGGLLGNGMIGNAARGALYGLGAAGQPGPKGFFAGVGRGAQQSIGMQQQRGQYGLGQALGQQQYQSNQIAQQGALRQGQLAQITLNYYRRMNGLPEVDANGQPMQQQAAGGGDAGPQIAGPQIGYSPTTGAGGNPVPGVRGASLAGVPEGSDQWWQQLYNIGQGMLAVPGQSGDALTMMEKAKAHDPSVIQTEAYAKAMGTAAGTPINVRPGGTVYLPGQGSIFQAPMQTEVVDNDPNSPSFGQKFKKWTTAGQQGGGGQQQGGGQAAPPAAPSSDNIYDAADADWGLRPGTSSALNRLENAGKDPTAVSPNGQGVGLMQINPNTVPPGTDLKKRLTNVSMGAQRYAEYNDKYQKYGKVNPLMPDWLAAAAYNWGPGNVDKWIFNGADTSKMPPGVLKYANDFVNMRADYEQQHQPQGQAAPPQVATGPGGMATELSVQQIEENKGEAGRNNQAREATQAAAEGAQKHIQVLDQMRSLSDEFRMGAGAGITATAQSWGQYFGITSDEANRRLGAYQDMRKLGITAGAGAIKDVSSREAIQGQKMIWEAQPNPGMSPDGFRRVVDGLQGADQAVIAKNQWMTTQPKGTAVEAAWAKNTNAQAANVFWLQRVAESDPALAAQIRDKLNESAGGQRLLQQIIQSKQWLQSQGLM